MQPADQPFDPAPRPLLLEAGVMCLLVVLSALRLLVATTAPLSADEAYYWQWTRPLQLSYFDHPAMVAWWIKAGIVWLGDTALGVRAMAVLAALLASLLVWDATRVAFRSRRAGALAALWLNALLLFGAAGVIMTPDSPLLVFWSLGLWALIRLIVSGRTSYLYLTALALGLGALSKYTIALMLPGIVVTFLAFRALWPWWRSRHGWRAVLLALLCTTPLILWNFENDWASFAKQLGHAFASEAPDPTKNLAAFVGGQLGLATPLILPFCLWGTAWALAAGWRQKRPEWFLLGATSLPILVFFLQHTQTGVVQAHWCGPAYIAGVMAAVGAFTQKERSPRLTRAFRAAPWLGLAMTLLVYLQAATAILPIPTKIDPLKRLGGWDELAMAVAGERTDHPGSFLFTQNHEPTGPIAFHLADHPPVFLEGPIRPSYYTAQDVEALKGRDGIFITRSRDDGAHDLAPYFDDVVALREIVLHWGGRPTESYTLYLASHYRGGLFVEGKGYNGAHDDGP